MHNVRPSCQAWHLLQSGSCLLLKPLWPSENVSSGVLSRLILPLPEPLHTKGGSGGLSPPPPAPTSHDGTAFGLFLLERGRDEFRTTGEVEQSLGEASDRALGGHWARLVQTHHGCGAEEAVDARL